jgi:hypothetical protein
MAEDAAAADLISGGRLQLGISRGSPEPALRGYESFGHVPEDGTMDADLARSRSSRSRPGSPTASGGDPARGRPRCGPPSRA